MSHFVLVHLMDRNFTQGMKLSAVKSGWKYIKLVKAVPNCAYKKGLLTLIEGACTYTLLALKYSQRRIQEMHILNITTEKLCWINKSVALTDL